MRETLLKLLPLAFLMHLCLLLAIRFFDWVTFDKWFGDDEMQEKYMKACISSPNITGTS